VIPFWPVNDSESAPGSKPEVIDTVAPLIVASSSLSVSVLVIWTAGSCAR
jgi:hypothetical protein